MRGEKHSLEVMLSFRKNGGDIQHRRESGSFENGRDVAA